ncbi:folylpolyglutamate synthase/dihydrofolate synthase family protein [soil metagenome]
MNDDPLAWLLSLEHLGMKFGLENMSRLAGALGHPERSFASIHVAGTNGKGSVTAMVDTALRAGGHHSARYTSPHLERLNERFVMAGTEVSTPALGDAVSGIRWVVEQLQRTDACFSPTFFECTTLAAFELFRREGVAIAVLEVGLGGRLDATNIVSPIASAITSIDFDHQALLGNTLASIAAEKAGIIKPGVPVVLGPVPGEAEQVIVDVATKQRAPLVRAAGAASRLTDIRPALLGEHQRDNADVAVAVLDTLRGSAFAVPDAAIRTGLEQVQWPGRLERIVSASTEFLIDAAHNRAGARALAAHLRQIGWLNAALVFGAMADKDIDGMLEELAPAVSVVVCTTAPSPRAENAERIAAIAARITDHASVRIVSEPEAAVATARALASRVVIAGSIFLIGPLRGILR